MLSDRSRLLYDYFTQLFAQVTNPPLDAIREELVTSLAATVGPEGNLLEAGSGLVPPDSAAAAGDRPRRPGQAACTSTKTGRRRASRPLPLTASSRWARPARPERRPRPGARRLARAMDDVRRRVSEAIADGANIIVLSDRNATEEWAPIPSFC